MTMTQTTTPHGKHPKVRFDLSYFKTKPGQLRLFAWFCSVLTIPFHLFDQHVMKDEFGKNLKWLNEKTKFFMSLSEIIHWYFTNLSGWGLFVMMMLYVFHVVEVAKGIPWYPIEIFLDGIIIVNCLGCGILNILIWSFLNECDNPVNGFHVVSTFLYFGNALVFFYEINTICRRYTKKVAPQGAYSISLEQP